MLSPLTWPFMFLWRNERSFQDLCLFFSGVVCAFAVAAVSPWGAPVPTRTRNPGWDWGSWAGPSQGGWVLGAGLLSAQVVRPSHTDGQTLRELYTQASQDAGQRPHYPQGALATFPPKTCVSGSRAASVFSSQVGGACSAGQGCTILSPPVFMLCRGAGLAWKVP